MKEDRCATEERIFPILAEASERVKPAPASGWFSPTLRPIMTLAREDDQCWAR